MTKYKPQCENAGVLFLSRASMQMMSKKKNQEFTSGMLSGHKKVGQKLKSDIFENFPLQKVSYIDKSIPEILHVSLIHDAFGWKDGIPKATKFLTLCIESIPQIPAPFVSYIGSADTSAKKELVTKLAEEKLLEPLVVALSPAAKNIPSWPLKFLGETDLDSNLSIEVLEGSVGRLLNKDSTSACAVMADFMCAQLESGRLKIAQHIGLPDFDQIIRDPESDEAAKARIDVRLNLMSLTQFGLNDQPSDWSETFWLEVSKISDCIRPDRHG